MKILKILLGLMLLSVPALASGNVEIHFNYPQDTIYAGGMNTMEIWIQNDENIEALSLAFELSGYTGAIIWDETYGADPPFGRHNDGDISLHLATDSSFLEDQELPDVVWLAGYALPDKYPLSSNSMRKVNSLQFEIPIGQPIG